MKKLRLLAAVAAVPVAVAAWVAVERARHPQARLEALASKPLPCSSDEECCVVRVPRELRSYVVRREDLEEAHAATVEWNLRIPGGLKCIVPLAVPRCVDHRCVGVQLRRFEEPTWCGAGLEVPARRRPPPDDPDDLSPVLFEDPPWWGNGVGEFFGLVREAVTRPRSTGRDCRAGIFEPGREP